MTQEDKELLFKDICARLPYGVKAEKYAIRTDGEFVPLSNIEIVTAKDIITLDKCPSYTIKPYLFPLSSMTRVQREEFVKFADYEPRVEDCGRHQELYYYDLVGHENNLYPNSDAIDWLNKNHFDYRGLIPKGLANDATGKNIY